MVLLSTKSSKMESQANSNSPSPHCPHPDSYQVLPILILSIHLESISHPFPSPQLLHCIKLSPAFISRTVPNVIFLPPILPPILPPLDPSSTQFPGFNVHIECCICSFNSSTSPIRESLSSSPQHLKPLMTKMRKITKIY